MLLSYKVPQMLQKLGLLKVIKIVQHLLLLLLLLLYNATRPRV